MASGMVAVARSVGEAFGEDPKTKVGCVIVCPKSRALLGIGWNSLPDGVRMAPDIWDSPDKYMYVVHAEVNAICKAAKNGVALEGSTCAVSLFPCTDCCRFLIQTGVGKVVAPEPDLSHPKWGAQWAAAMYMLKQAKVDVEHPV